MDKIAFCYVSFHRDGQKFQKCTEPEQLAQKKSSKNAQNCAKMLKNGTKMAKPFFRMCEKTQKLDL